MYGGFIKYILHNINSETNLAKLNNWFFNSIVYALWVHDGILGIVSTRVF